MKCRNVRQMMGAYLYGDLSPEDMKQLREHVDACPECREDLREQGTVTSALDNTPCQLDDDDRQQIMWSVKGAVRAKERSRPHPARRFAPALALAAVLALGFAVGSVVSLHRTSPGPTSAVAPPKEPPLVNVDVVENPARNPEVTVTEQAAADSSENVSPTPQRRPGVSIRYPTAVLVGRHNRQEHAQPPSADTPLPVVPDTVDKDAKEDGATSNKLPEPVDLGETDETDRAE